ncbi:hypothetical protein [Halioxenophilus sp. WMMB6]|uniref:hypothetical protein n=1 Tax=Halioxenophilus sp. WMMB6 TaxID=3073815 RepID=UPI00295E5D69|nr:hypothetical protein [Halioxenophilus sp. WMMB6]
MRQKQRSVGFAGYSPWFIPVLVVATVVVVASGVGLLPSMLEFKFYLEPPLTISMQSRVAVAATHCGAGIGLFFLVGALWQAHMRSGWRRKKQRWSGVILLVCFALLGLSALGLYYFGAELSQQLASVLHMAAAVVFAGLMLWHGLAHRFRAAAKATLAEKVATGSCVPSAK